MKNKNIILFSAAVLLGILGILLNDPFGFFKKTYLTSEPLLENFNPQKVASFAIHNPPEEVLIFFRKNSGWFIKKRSQPEVEYRVRNEIINDALLRLNTITRYLLVSENQERFSEMRLTREHQHIIIKQEENPDITLHIGSSGGRSGTNLTRLGSEDKVYLAKGRVRSYWGKSLDYYRSKRLFFNVPKELASVHVRFQSKEWGNRDYHISFEKEKGWSFTEKNKEINIEGSIVKKFSQGLLFSTGKHFYLSKKIPPEFARVKFIFKDNSEKILDVAGPDVGHQFTGRSQDNPYWMMLEHEIIDFMIYFPNLPDPEAASRKILSPDIP